MGTQSSKTSKRETAARGGRPALLEAQHKQQQPAGKINRAPSCAQTLNHTQAVLHAAAPHGREKEYPGGSNSLLAGPYTIFYFLNSVGCQHAIASQYVLASTFAISWHPYCLGRCQTKPKSVPMRKLTSRLHANTREAPRVHAGVRNCTEHCNPET